MFRHTVLFLWTVLLFLLTTDQAFSNERRFGYTYESSVLPAGAREIELWNTYRTGREYFYRRLDQRVEYEFGLGGNLMSAFYLNITSRSKDDNEGAPGGSTTALSEFSISSEWKYKIMDRVADPFGLAVYGEGTLATDEYEIEGKLIADKQLTNLLFAFDLAGEYESASEVINGTITSNTEYSIDADAGVSYIFSSGLGAGIEMRLQNVYSAGTLQHSSLFVGPTLSYASESLWTTFTVLPQQHSFHGGTAASGTLDLDEYEKIQARLLLSFHF